MLSRHPPILGPKAEWIRLKEAIDYSGRSDRTLRYWCREHGIGRQSSKGAPIEISLPALEMVIAGDLEALEYFRAGDRAHPRVLRVLAYLGLKDMPSDQVPVLEIEA
jgi:hypothetical protein